MIIVMITVRDIDMILDIPCMFQLCSRLVTFIAISMIPVMIPVLTIAYSCFGFMAVPIMYPRYNYSMICNSDSICLGLLWYEIRVYL